MKIRLIRDDLGVPPGAIISGGTSCQDIIVGDDGQRRWRVGTEMSVTAREAQLLVGNCDAEPADAEAEQACGNWRHNRSEALLSRDMLARGIEPEDRDRYRRGELLGYDADGRDIPGPNAIIIDEEEEDEYE